MLWNWFLVKCEFEGIMFLKFSSKRIKLVLQVNGGLCGFWLLSNDEMHAFQGVLFFRDQHEWELFPLWWLVCPQNVWIGNSDKVLMFSYQCNRMEQVGMGRKGKEYNK